MAKQGRASSGSLTMTLMHVVLFIWVALILYSNFVDSV